MPALNERKKPSFIVTTRRPSSSDSTTAKTPRTARFAEATTVYSPVEAPSKGYDPFADRHTNHYVPQPQVADIGFGYLHSHKPAHESVEMEDTDRQYLPPPTPGSPLRSPLKSALKSPGAPSRTMMNELRSPMFREEQLLEKAESHTDKEQARDLVSRSSLSVY